MKKRVKMTDETNYDDIFPAAVRREVKFNIVEQRTDRNEELSRVPGNHNDRHFNTNRVEVEEIE
jgi:hypothetical protein